VKPEPPARAEKEVGAPKPHPKPAQPERGTPKVEPKPAPEKTYSDEEILASVNTPEPTERKPARNAPPWIDKRHEEKKPLARGKPSRATPKHQTRLWMNVGEAMDVKPIDIVNAVAGETGLPGKVVGTVDVRERHLFVDVDSDHANGIIAKLNRAQIKGHKVKVKVA
jgi:ATP-dependent RNA helicase DeaD